MATCYVFKNNKIIKDVSLKQVKKYLKDRKATIWLDLYRPTDEEHKFLQEAFSFHTLSIEDCAKAINLPKIDVFEKYLFIVFHGATSNYEKVDFKKREIDFFLGKNFLVSVHSYPSLGVEHLKEQIETSKKIKSKPDFLLYQIIDRIVDLYFPMLDDWEDHIEELEEEIIQKKHPKNTLKQIMDIKKEVLKLRKSITPQIEVINKFTKKGFPFIQQQTSVYFKDVYDHLMRIYSELETQRDLLKNAFDAHTTTMSSQMIETSNKMNEVMKKLTIIATIFMPLTFITGVYGMNFRYMPEIYWHWGYFAALGFMLVLGLFMFFFFKKKRWT